MVFHQEIQELTTTVWDSMLHMPVEEVDAQPIDERTISACVHISGAWSGTLALSCRAELAEEAAAAMFGIDRSSMNIGDIQDALGELVNMIGGNVKALFPGACQLSTPAVAEGADYNVKFPGSRVVTRVPMRCGNHALSVSLLETLDKAA